MDKLTKHYQWVDCPNCKDRPAKEKGCSVCRPYDNPGYIRIAAKQYK